MAITKSSRAITSTSADRSIGQRALWTTLVVLVAAPAASAATRPPRLSPSFFEPFNGFNRSMWYVSDGWTNGAHQGCTWSANNISLSNGIVRLRLGPARDKLRPYRCAEFRTWAATGYGTYEVRMKTAAGSGLNTAMFTYSGRPMTPVHDEIDFEFLGKAPTRVQLNYFENGHGQHSRDASNGFDASAGFNDYAFEWSPGRIRWFINGRLVRQEVGNSLPTVPGQFIFSLWNGSARLDDWLGAYASRGEAVAEIDWAAYTRLNERCRFRQSITCRK